LNLSGAPANTGAFLGIGLSSTSSTLGPLPFSLEPLGGTGCSVLMSADSFVLRVVDGLGTTTGSLSIPNVPAFVSTRLFAQYLVIHPTANTLGMVVTAGSNIFLGN